MVAEGSGIDRTWGLHFENLDATREVAEKMADGIENADSEAVAGDCSPANGAIVLETGRTPLSPMRILRRAYRLGD